MKRMVLPILVIGVLLLSACGAPTTVPVFTGGPRISFEQDSVYLGKATPDQRMLYDFRFWNVGDAPLVVYNTTVKALDGC